jgi:hypothetical protein
VHKKRKTFILLLPQDLFLNLNNLIFALKYLPDIGEGCVLSEFHAADRKKIEKGQAGDCIDDSVHMFL